MAETGNRRDRGARAAVLATGLLVSLLGLVGLLGWVTGNQVLTAVDPTRFTELKANTAVALVLFGATLLMTLGRGRGWAVARRVVVSVVLTFAVVNTLQFVLGWDAGIDQLLFVDLPGPHNPYPGRMSVNASLALVLLGAAALASGERGRLPLWAVACTVAGALSGVVALAGYLMGAAPLYGVPGVLAETALSLPAALATVLLGAGLLASAPNALTDVLGSQHTGGTASRRFLVISAIMLPVAALVATGTRLGVYSQATALALMATVGAAMVVVAALVVGQSLNRLDVLRERQERELSTWKRFFDLAPTGAAFVATDGALLACNPALLSSLATTKEALSEREATFRALDLGPELADQLTALPPGASRTFETHARRDGATFSRLVVATAGAWPQTGEPAYLLLVQDVTEQRKAEQTRELMARVVELASDAVITTDTDGVVLTWNRAAERIYGYSAAEMVGNQAVREEILPRMVPPELRGESQALREALLRGERIDNFETTRIRKDGEPRVLSLSLAPLTDTTGSIYGIASVARDVTEQRRWEQALRSSEESFRVLVEHASDGIFLADPEGRYTQVNSVGAAMLGYPGPAELRGKTIADLLPPEDLPRLTASRTRVFQGETVVDDWNLRRADGRFLPVEVSAKLLPDGRWLGMVRDISARKQAEEALQHAMADEARTRIQLEAVTRASFAVSEALASLPSQTLQGVLQAMLEQGRQVTQADSALVMLSPEYALGGESMRVAGVSSELSAELHQSLARQALETVGAKGAVRLRRGAEGRHALPDALATLGCVLVVPIRHHHKDIGRLLVAQKRGLPEFTPDDQRLLEMLVGPTALAIETALLYHRLQVERARLDAIIQQLPEGVLICNERGEVRIQNQAARFLLGGEVATAVAVRMALRSSGPEHLLTDEDEDPLGEALRTRVGVPAREYVVARESGPVPILFGAAPIHDREGALVGVTAVLRDISPIKQLERLREEWTSVVAHDLRQPLNYILLAASRLMHTRPEEHHEVCGRMLPRIRESGRTMNRMIEDLLDASRLEARRLVLNRTALELGSVLHGLAEQFEQQYPGRSLQLVLPEHPAWTWADPMRLEQVLQNLVSNAVKYGRPDGEVQLEVQHDGEQVEISVRNEGAGIPAERIPDLFQRFRRLSPQDEKGGIGLGLYISRGLVEAHGGRMRVESQVGGTTTFSFTLPSRPPAHPLREAEVPARHH